MGENAAMIENHKSLLQKLDGFCFGNGSTGAKDRLTRLENIVIGKEECRAMEDVRKHKEWHDKMSGRRWELYAGFIVVIAAQILTTIFMK